ncbi:MAG: efflux RND transporter periplasmic adaptor subunit [Chlorobi bacterium]|nr:MAG: efflux RND transporter periplasmic adaptor subunit [Bacteroidota bacterium]MBL1161270.1 efflux RND transporter periplasmic adaptor subunit [Chlorobiota bacterium]
MTFGAGIKCDRVQKWHSVDLHPFKKHRVMHKTVRYVLIAIAAIAVIALFIVFRPAPQASVPMGGGRGAGQTLTVSGYVVHAAPFSEQLTVSGVVRASEEVTVYPEISGRVISIHAAEGSYVQANQVLVKLDDTEQQAQLARLIAQLRQDSLSLSRIKSLRSIDGVSVADLDAAETQLATRRAEIAQAKAVLHKTVIRAPFPGKVGLRNISPGAVVTPQTAIMKFADISTLKVDVSVPDRYAYAVGVGSVLMCSAPSRSGTDTVRARVYAVDPVVDADTRTLRVRAIIEKRGSGNTLVPGTVVDVNVGTATYPKALLIPTEAIQPGMDGSSVFVVNGGKAALRAVQTGGRSTSLVQIVHGISAGDTVATSGLLALKDGFPVHVQLTNSIQ